MNWKAKVVAFAKRVGPACKFAAKTVLSTMIPGSPAVIELVEHALDCASTTADKVWEVEKDSAAARDLERVGTLLETMQKQMGADLKQIAGQIGRPDEARRILDKALANSAKLREVGEQLQTMATGFDRLEVHMVRVAGRQELSIDLQQQMLDMQRLSIGLMLTMYDENESTSELRDQFRSALAALGEGRMAAAYPALTALVNELPGSSAVLGALGVVQAVENNLPAAQKSLDRATRLNPTNRVLQRLSDRVTRFLTDDTPVDAPLRVGERLGGWEIIQLLGSGGSGQVVKGRKAEQIAALKVLHGRLSRNESILADFKKEMMALMQLRRQRHLVEILDFGFCQQQRRDYFVMTFVQGMSLQTYLDRHGLLSLEQAVRCFRPVAEALGRAHALEIFHLDVKPGNLMRADADGSLTLVDFGLTGATMARGTLSFTSPEQLRGLPGDTRSDVYSLAATLYYALTQELPDHFRRGSIAQAGLADLLAQSLATNPRDRPANATEFAARLELGPQTQTLPKESVSLANQASRMAETTAWDDSVPRQTRQDMSVSPAVTVLPCPSSVSDCPSLDDQRKPGTQIQTPIETPYAARLMSKSRMVKAIIAASALFFFIAVAAIVFVRTRYGEVVIELNDPLANVAVKVDGERIDVNELNKPLTLTTGAHELVVNGPDFELVTRSFTVNNSKNQVLKVTLRRKGEVVINSIGMKLAYIPLGTFSMGSPDQEKGRGADEEEHEVGITKGFYLGVYEVTQEEYEKVIKKNPSHFSLTGHGKAEVEGVDTSRFPVEDVSYSDAVNFCAKLSESPGEREKKRIYRLPTEAEWEYACRGEASSKPPFYFGKSLSSDQANFNGQFPYGGADEGRYLKRTCRVGSYNKPNGYGLFDMHGNVWEWCSDRYGKNYYGNSPTRDPQGPSEGFYKVFRGGSWNSLGQFCRSATRESMGEDYRNNDIGFRVALVTSAQE